MSEKLKAELKSTFDAHVRACYEIAHLTTEIAKLHADNKALLDALKDAEGYVNGRSRQSEQVRKNIRAAIAQAEHSEPQ